MSSVYGLIGYPLSHSFSPEYFTKKFEELEINAKYNLYPLENIGLLKGVLDSEPLLCGLNVTVPYKQTILPFLDNVDNTAFDIGAVNCIKITNSKLSGYNTDVVGFEKSLTPLLQPQHTKALILGTGGASKAVGYTLKKIGIPYTLVSRNKKQNTISYEDVDSACIEEHLLIINTTPLGMYPNMQSTPHIPYKHIGHKHLLYDLVYNPTQTVFLHKGHEQGATVKNGLEMLQIQAEASWGIWNS